MAHTAQSQTRRIGSLIRRHRDLKTRLKRALDQCPDSNSLRWPFEKAYRPWSGDVPTPEQDLGIAFRQALGKLISDLRNLFSPWDDVALLDQFPLVNWESGSLNNQSSDFVLKAIEHHIDSLQTELTIQNEQNSHTAQQVQKVADTMLTHVSETPVGNNQEAGIDLIEVHEVASLTGHKKARVYDLISKGKFPGVVRFGRQIRVDRKKLLNFIESGGSDAE